MYTEVWYKNHMILKWYGI